jgi:LytS/YehU family sensor histidine kinase
MILLGLLLIYALVILRFKQLRKREAAKQELERMIYEYRMTALRSQMTPHFIFNVITSIQHYVLDNNRMESYDYLSKFGRLMRLVLENSKEKYITLFRELETLSLYIELEQLRLNKKFDWAMTVSEAVDTERMQIPSMLVQPYIENAIKHGLAPRKQGGVLTINFEAKDDILTVTVNDNGVGRVAAAAAREKQSHHSMGMEITVNRIEVLSRWHNKKFEVAVTDKYNEAGIAEGTLVLITIPVII